MHKLKLKKDSLDHIERKVNDEEHDLSHRFVKFRILSDSIDQAVPNFYYLGKEVMLGYEKAKLFDHFHVLTDSSIDANIKFLQLPKCRKQFHRN